MMRVSLTITLLCAGMLGVLGTSHAWGQFPRSSLSRLPRLEQLSASLFRPFRQHHWTALDDVFSDFWFDPWESMHQSNNIMNKYTRPSPDQWKEERRREYESEFERRWKEFEEEERIRRERYIDQIQRERQCLLQRQRALENQHRELEKEKPLNFHSSNNSPQPDNSSELQLDVEMTAGHQSLATLRIQGYRAEDISASISGRLVTVTGQRTNGECDSDNFCHHSEFSQSFLLPDHVDETTVTVALDKHGLLRITGQSMDKLSHKSSQSNDDRNIPVTSKENSPRVDKLDQGKLVNMDTDVRIIGDLYRDDDVTIEVEDE